MSNPIRRMSAWVERYRLSDGVDLPGHWEPVDVDSPIGRLFEHPNITSVVITYDDEHTTTYRKGKPDE